MAARVLIACEASGRVRRAFTAMGCDAWSCDLLSAEDGEVKNHITGDVLPLLQHDWDLVIAHPPCTYLSRAGARWLYPQAGKICPSRLGETRKAAEFFYACLNAKAPRVAVENPYPVRVAGLPKWQQVIHPYQHGDPYTKATLLWLKGLPKLRPTKIVEPVGPWLRSNTGFGKNLGQRSQKGQVSSSRDASRTFLGIAQAMAWQWGELLQDAERAA